MKGHLREDSVKYSKKLQREALSHVSAVEDSLNLPVSPSDIVLDSTIVDKSKRKAKAVAKDTLDNYVDIPDITIDSTTTDQVKGEIKQVAIDSINGQEFIKNTSVISDVRELDSLRNMSVDSLGSTLKTKARERLEEEFKNSEEFKELGNMEGPESELSKMEDYKEQLEQTQEELKQALAEQKLKEKLAGSAKEYISKNADKISQVQSKMGELKKKYSYMPNSNDLSSAVKRTSLEGESLWKRLVLGGNFNIGKTNPLSIDLSPVFGYKFNKLFEAGITATYRTKFKADKYRISAHSDEVYGYSIFANHMVFRNFFGYLEGERMSTLSTGEDQVRSWKQTLMIGMGRKFNVSKWLEMQAMVLFNVLHDNQDGLYNSPVVFKTGMRVRK